MMTHLEFEDAIMDPFALMRHYCSSLYRCVLPGFIPASAFMSESQVNFHGIPTKHNLVPRLLRNWRYGLHSI